MNETGKYFLLSLSVFLVIIVVSMLYLGPKTRELKYIESPIEKVEELQLEPRERYTYMYTSPEANTTMTYAVFQGGGCTGIYIKEIEDSGVCIDRYGNDKNGSNLSLSDPLIYFFRPWMLAVHEDWKWNATMVMEDENIYFEMSVLTFETEGIETINGREAYRVKMREGGNEGYAWVDKEKRILLKEVGKGYMIELISSPLGEEQ